MGKKEYRSIDEVSRGVTVNAACRQWVHLELAINPVNPYYLYATTSNSGVFRSTNSGTTWSAINTGLVDEHQSEADH